MCEASVRINYIRDPFSILLCAQYYTIMLTIRHHSQIITRALLRLERTVNLFGGREGGRDGATEGRREG